MHGRVAPQAPTQGSGGSHGSLGNHVPELSVPTCVPAPAYQASSTGLRFVVLIEGTVAAASLWPDARAMCVEPLLRDMDRGKLGPCEFAVVVYRSHESPYAGAEVESSGWLSSVGEVRQVLDGVQLLGGGQCEGCLVDALQEVMALTEQPSSIGLGGAGPPCQVLLVFASEFSRMGVLLDYPPAPHVTRMDGSDITPADRQQGPVFFQHMSNGAWRHTHCSLVSAIKHSHHVSLSVVMLRERLQTGLALFLGNMLGYCGQGSLMNHIMSANKPAVHSANVPLTTKAYAMFVAPTWPAAKSVLAAERQARAGAAGMRGQPGSGQQPQQQGASGRMPTPNSAMALPSPLVGSTPAYATPPLQPTPGPPHMDGFGQHTQQPGMVPQPAGPLPAGMIPTPPSATQASSAMPAPSGWVPTPGMPSSTASAASQAGMRPGMYPSSGAPSGGMVPDPTSMQPPQQHMGGMGMYPGGPGTLPRPQAMPQPGYGAPQQYVTAQQQYAAAAAAQQQQYAAAQQQAMQGGVWGQGSGDLSARSMGMPQQGGLQGAGLGLQPGSMQPGSMQGQPGASTKTVVWAGKLAIHGSLLRNSMVQNGPIVIAHCVAESSSNSKPQFASWPADLVINNLMSSKDVQKSINGMHPIKVTLRVTQAVPSNPPLAHALSTFVDEMSKNSLLGIVVLGPGVSGNPERVLVQLKNAQPAADTVINAAWIFPTPGSYQG